MLDLDTLLKMHPNTNVPKEHLESFMNSVKKEQSFNDLKIVTDYIYLHNCSLDELVLIHGFAESRLKKEGIINE